MKKALILNNIASAGSIFWRICGQLLLPPLLMAVWGTDRYGEWLLIASIPMLLSVTDLGFTDAASAEMLMELAKGNRNKALGIFQSTLLLIVGVSSFICLLMSGILFLDHVNIGSIAFSRDDILAIYLLVFYSILQIFSRFVLGTLKAGGYYAASTLVYDVIQFSEGISMFVVARLGGSFLMCGAVYVAIRLVNIAVLLVMQKRALPWLLFGTRQASRGEILRLTAPALAAMAIPLALAMNFQGMVWIAGSVLGPTAAAVVGTVRTASRVVIQLIGIFSRAAMPLYSASYATEDKRTQNLLQRINTYLTVFLLVPGGILFAVIGNALVSLWTHGKIQSDQDFLVLMAIATVLHGIWFFRCNLLLAINQHTQFALLLTVLTALALIAAIPAVHAWGLDGVGGMVIGLELLTVLGLFRLQYKGAG